MRRLSALVSVVVKAPSARIGIAIWLAILLVAATEIVTSVSALPSDPTPPLSSRTLSIPNDFVAPQLPRVHRPLSLINNFTASVQFHIPDSPIDLTFTSFGWPLVASTIHETANLAVDRISTNVDLHPTDSIANGIFRQRHRDLVIIVHEYVGKQVTWYLLRQLLLGIEYWTVYLGRSTELEFEIDVAGKGRVGYGALRLTENGGSDIARRAINATTLHGGVTSTSKLGLTNLTGSMPSPIPNEGYLSFSYHFFGLPVSEFAMSTCFRTARQSIGLNLLYHPLGLIPNGRFQHRPAYSPISVIVEAFPDKRISWLLLDRVLSHVKGHMISQRSLWECWFEFEIAPITEPHGRGYLKYSPRSERSRRTIGR